MTALSVANSLETSNSTALSQATGAGSNQQLGQEEFIELLVAQLENQDPTKPLDPSEFMNQLAQFSTVNGITELNTSFNSLADKLASDNSIRAAEFVGRSVMVPGGLGQLTAGGDISGNVDLDTPTSGLTLSVINEAGETVRTLPMGAQQRGESWFSWNGTDDNGDPVAPGRYRIEANALIDGSNEAVPVNVETRVESISLNQEQGGVPGLTLLNLQTGERLPIDAVTQIK